MVLALLLLASPLGAPAAREAAGICRDLGTQLDTIVSAPAFDGSRMGLYVHLLDSDKVLYAHNADDLLVPASNVKIVSTAAALYYLGTDYRFVTEVYGELDANKSVNRLYLKGYGDPWLVPERVWYLADRLYYAGVRQVRGEIIADDSYYEGDRDAIGWEQDRTTYAYMAPRGALSVGFNTVLVHIYPGPSAGEAAEVLIEPQSSYTKIDGTVTTTSGHTRLLIDIVPDGDRSVVKVGGTINVRESGRGYYRRIDNPPIYAGEVFRQALERAGINARVARVKTGVVPEGAGKIAELYSPRLSELVERVNKHSNNFMAEQIALATGAAAFGAPATWDKAQAAIEKFLGDAVGLPTGSYTIRNASGLHDVNRFSPRQMVRILSWMYEQPRFRPEYLASMSVAGTSGTLSSRMRDSEAAGLLRAKTGTLSIASALSGYVSAKRGETVAFSMLVNDYTTAISDVLAAQDEVGAALAAYDSQCKPTQSPAVVSGTTPTEYGVP